MDELERRLSAAMLAAAEPPPPGLLEAIRRRHRRHRRRVGAGFAAVAAVVVLAVVPVARQLSAHHLRPAAGGTGPSGAARTSPRSSRPPPVLPRPAPGTISLTCHDANWGQLPGRWQADSLRVGPLWFAYALQQGYARLHASPLAGSPGNAHGAARVGVMVVEVADGATVTLKAAPSSRSYFRFLDGFHSGGGNRLPAADTGFSFIACPRSARPGPNGRFTDFYLGFSLQAGRQAAADVWTPPERHPTQVIFTCPGGSRGCGT